MRRAKFDGQLRAVAVILDSAVIERILTHLRQQAKAPHQALDRAAGHCLALTV